MEAPGNAIVTGAGSGIGRATSLLLAKRGWRVACLDRDGEAAAKTAREAGEAHRALAVDVAEEAQVDAAFAEIAQDFGALDALATCAGINDTTPFLRLSPASFRRLYEVNVIGSFLAIRAAARHMKKGGRICTVSSVAGLRGGGVAGTAAYAASKGAVIALTKSAARSLAEQEIAVNCVAPGPIETPMFDAVFGTPGGGAARQRVTAMIPLGRTGRAEEAAESIVWLLSPAASFVNGATLAVDGGLVMP